MHVLDSQDATDSDEVDETFSSKLDFDDIVDPANWQAPGDYYRTMPAITRSVVNKVVESDERLRQELREEYFPQSLRDGALLDWKSAVPRYIEQLQRKRLYQGKVVAADATLAKYETLSLVGAQIAVSRVSYQETTAQLVSNLRYWGKELPRKMTPAQLIEAIRSRGDELKDKIPNIFLYALALYKERQILLDTPPDTFKLIQGTLFPHEMLTGVGTQFTMLTCLNLIGELIDDGNYATIVSNDSHRVLTVLGMALEAGEYIVVRKGTEALEEFRRGAHYVPTKIPQYGNRSQVELFEEFQKTYGPKVVQGVLRAHRMSAPYVFYCNEDRLEEAVHILLADAANTGPRGFPLLLDLADQYCSGAFRAGEYTHRMNAEFSRAAGGSGMYQAERQTRD